MIIYYNQNILIHLLQHLVMKNSDIFSASWTKEYLIKMTQI